MIEVVTERGIETELPLVVLIWDHWNLQLQLLVLPDPAALQTWEMFASGGELREESKKTVVVKLFAAPPPPAPPEAGAT